MAGTMQILVRAMSEPAYRDLLFADFDRAVEGFDLDDDERASLREIMRQGFNRIVGGMMAHLLVPIRASRRILVMPAALPPLRATGEVTVRLAPRLAFGNGAHESTRVCLAALEDHIHPGDRVLDLGAGTGILSIAAVGLGAKSALALDINAAAVEAAQENIALNGLSGAARAEVGSLSDVLSGRFGPAPQFDVVVANILPHVILEFVRDGIGRVLAPGGRLIVSGMQRSQVQYVSAVLPAAGLEEAERRAEGSWLALVLRHKPAAGDAARAAWRGGVRPGWSLR